MQHIFDLIEHQPMYGAMVVLLALLLVLSVVKNLLKAALLVMAIILLYGAFLHNAGRDHAAARLAEKTEGIAETIKEKAEVVRDKAESKIKEKLIEADVPEKIGDAARRSLERGLHESQRQTQ